MVRIKPENINGKEGDWEITRVSSDALCIGDIKFMFDEVFLCQLQSGRNLISLFDWD